VTSHEAALVLDGTTAGIDESGVVAV